MNIELLVSLIRNKFKLETIYSIDNTIVIQHSIGYGLVLVRTEEKLIITPIITCNTGAILDIRNIQTINTQSQDMLYIIRQIKEKIFDSGYINNYYSALLDWKYKQ